MEGSGQLLCHPMMQESACGLMTEHKRRQAVKIVSVMYSRACLHLQPGIETHNAEFEVRRAMP